MNATQQTKTENGVEMIFCGLFLGLEVWRRADTEMESAASRDSTAVVEHEEIAA